MKGERASQIARAFWGGRRIARAGIWEDPMITAEIASHRAMVGA